MENDQSIWPNHQLSRFVDAAGIRWHVQEDGDGPALLLIHGTGASTHSWRHLIPILAQHYRVLALDLPGHAFSDSASAAQSSIPGMSAMVAGLLQALKFEPRYCVGHSAGAVVLCQMALLQQIDPCVIISINGAFLPLSGLPGLAFSWIAKLFAGNKIIPRLLARRAADPIKVMRVLSSTGSNIDAECLSLYARLVREPRHMTGTLRMLSNWNLGKFERHLPDLRTPLVLIVAENDLTVSPSQAMKVQHRVADAKIVSLPMLGHLAHEEAPEVLARHIMQICGRYRQ